MKIIIDIPEEEYNIIKKSNAPMVWAKHLIADGTPLPKRMLSVDLIIETLCPKDEDYDYPCIAPSYLEEELERLLLDDVSTELKDIDSDYEDILKKIKEVGENND